MATTVSYASTPIIGACKLSVANPNRDGTGTLVTLLTVGASGSRVERLRIVPVGTTTAGVVRFYLHDGSIFYLLDEKLIAAVTPSATAVQTFTEWATPDLNPPTGWSIRVSTEKAENFNVFAYGGSF